MLLKTLFLSTAFAQSTDTTDDATDALDSPELESSPLYVGLRSSVAVPADASGMAYSVGLAIGTRVNEKNFVGMRGIYMDSPPKNPITPLAEGVTLDVAYGPVLDWQHVFKPNASTSFFTNTSAGFIFGAPTRDGTSANVDDDDLKNVILPVLEFGVGMRLARQTNAGNLVYVSPEFGVVPGALAPYAAVNVGTFFQGS